MGASKAAYYQSQRGNPKVKGLVLCAPPDLSQAFLAEKPAFRTTLSAAAEEVQEGRAEEILVTRLPLRGFVSARTFLNKYGPNEIANLLNYVDAITCPVLLVCGTLDHLVQYAEVIR
ncbi:MAG: hypothetical protein HY675_20010 [Chloroflexi bacterium]|nr:hypothetical protein [Chloroflexota bacterium]